MKKGFLLTLLLVFFSINLGSAALIDDCNNIYGGEMEAYFRFNDALTDVIGQVTATSSGPSYSSGVSGNGIVLANPINLDDGSGSTETEITFGASPYDPKFTLMFWYDPVQTGYNGPILNFPPYFNLVSQNGKIKLIAGSNTLEADYDDSDFSFIVVRWDFTDLELYVAAKSESSIGSVDAFVSPGNLGDSTGIVNILNTNTQAIIDELAIYSTDLTDSQISSAFSKTKSGSNYCQTSSGESSIARTEFSIAGCKILDSSGNVEYSLSKGACSRDGLVYCGTNGVVYDTLLPNDGCSFGQETWDVGNPMCCPSTHVCTPEEDGTGQTEYSCNLPETDCGLYAGDESSCSDNGCYWFELDSGTGEGECISNPKDQSCSVYENEDACNQDNYNIGGTGVGTDVCDTLETGFFDFAGIGQFIIPESSCGCKWNPAGGEGATGACELSWTMTEALFETGASASSFECLTEFSIGKCLAGEQLIQWTTRTANELGVFTTAVNLDVARTESRCVDGTLSRSCGETILKFSGFSSLAIILVILVLGIFYFFRKHKNFSL